MTAIKPAVAINLSYWLYKVHPEIFARLQKMVPGGGGKLGALGDDGGGDFLPGITPYSGDTVTTSFDVGNIDTSSVDSAISPDLVSLPEPQLDTVSLDVNNLPTPDFQIASDSAASSGLSSSTASTVGAVAGVLTAGLGALASVTTAIYKAGSPQAATIAKQASLAQAGVNPAPITYGYNSAGQLVPILQTPTTTLGLSPQTLSNLGLPTSWTPYVIPVTIGVVVVALIAGASKR